MVLLVLLVFSDFLRFFSFVRSLFAGLAAKNRTLGTFEAGGVWD